MHFSIIIIVSVNAFVQENETKQKETYYRELGIYKELGIHRELSVYIRELEHCKEVAVGLFVT